MPPTLFVKGNLEATKWSEPQKELDEIIPIDYIMNWIGSRAGKIGKTAGDRILIVHSSTGSGKSTVMPAELFHRFYETTGKRSIACTQPRVLTAMDIPKNQIVPYHTAEALRAQKSSRTPLVMGENIGFQTGAESKKPNRGLIFMTIGVLVQQMNIMSDAEFMKKYAFIIIDEAHERSTNTDTALFNLKKFIHKNYENVDCPFLIVTSATFDAIKYADYLLDDDKNRYTNIIRVRGSTFPIKEEFLEYDSANYIKSCLDKVVSIHTKNANDFLTDAEYAELQKSDLGVFVKDASAEIAAEGQHPRVFRDIIIFVSGAGDIKALIRGLQDLNSRHLFFKKYPVFPLQLTGEIVTAQSADYRNLFSDINKLTVEVYQSGDKGQNGKNNRNGKNNKKHKKHGARDDELFEQEQEQIINEDHMEIVEGTYGGGEGRGGFIKMKPTRRVIVSTNVGETGITIDTLRYVIDSGWVNASEYSPNYNVEMLVNRPVTVGMYKQRRGRSGRKDNGFSFAMYTKKTLDLLQVDQYPDIIKEDISLVILNLLIREIDSSNRNNNESLAKLLNDEKFWELVRGVKINIYKTDLLDMPSADMLHSAMEKLFVMGAIDVNSIPTGVGFIMNKVRKVPIESVRMILAGFAWKASITDLITIAAFIEIQEGSLIPRNLEANHKAALIAGEFSIYSLRKTFNYGSDNAYLRDQLLTVCDFVKYVVIYHKFQEFLSNIIHSGDETLTSLQAWCESVGLSYSVLVGISEARDEIIHNLASVGLDPFANYDKSMYNLVESYSDYDFLDYTKNIKQCVFEGYKLNIAIYDGVQNCYKTRKARLPLIIDSLYFSTIAGMYSNDHNPKYIIVSNIIVRKNKQTNMYDVHGSGVTVLDGFIEFDTYFDSLLA